MINQFSYIESYSFLRLNISITHLNNYNKFFVTNYIKIYIDQFYLFNLFMKSMALIILTVQFSILQFFTQALLLIRR